MKRCIILFICGISLLGCKKETETVPLNYSVKFEAQLTAKGGLPETISKATGKFTGTYNRTTKILTYVLTYEGLTPSAAHFHKGTTKDAGAVAVNIATAIFNTPLSSQTVALTTAQETDLQAGLWYVNIHSALYPNGEIRGQLIKQ
jgi:CHRD domain